MSPPPIRVAQYVRMSTDHQRYSTENQADAIAAYATLHDMEVVRRYVDSGKSGLKIAGRDGLSRLLSDVKAGTADYEAILVYDVSRWGRFQNADESASYEYLCTERGINVIYVAENFENDGTPIAAIIKAVKRGMAAEYSRELSVKVFAGHCRLIGLGFHQGGTAGFGLRRQVLTESGSVKGTLQAGERKGLQSDRVVLVRGPLDEIETVQRIFDMFVHERMSERVIALRLNHELRTSIWNYAQVRHVLGNERYIGNNVYNRTSFKLKKKHVTNKPEHWLRSRSGADFIVSAEMFECAQAIFLERAEMLSDEQMLDMLRTLREREGLLSGVLIDQQADMPSSHAYQTRFGGLTRAYALIGYEPRTDRRYLAENAALRARYPAMLQTVIQGFANVGAEVSADPTTDLLTINKQLTAVVSIARCSHARGMDHWHLRFEESLRPDIAVCVRMARNNTEALDYYVFSRFDLAVLKRGLTERNHFAIDAYRFDNLAGLYELAALSPLEIAA
ncbi:recombinase family protein [soil metagenome]